MSASQRKRKTIKPTTCPNPLFLQWLTEWRDEAASRNSDIKYCFDKAIRSLQKYPIKLNSGKECLILKNFGTQLSVKLDRKLAEYKKSNPSGGDDIPSTSTSTVPPPKPKSNPSKAAAKRKKKPVVETDQEVKSNDEPSPTKKMKMYVPGWRSGPYALLIALYNEQTKPTYNGYMKKAELIEKAQSLCDSSFSKPDPGSYYTAWSSMTTVVKKGLVSRQGNPARYSLTKEGETLAQKLLNDSDTELSTPHDTVSQAKCGYPSFSMYDSDNETSSKPLPKKNTDIPKKAKLPKNKVYIPSVSDSEDEDDPPLSNRKMDLVDLTDDNANVTDILTKAKLPKNKVYIPSVSDSEDEDDPPLSNQKMDLIDITDDNIEDSVPLSTYDELIENSRSSASVDTQPSSQYEPTPSLVASHRESTQKSCSTSSSSSSVPSYVLLPGEFDIILLVDTAETTGKARNALSDDPVKELTNLSVRFEVRHLKVGDFTWICRSRSESHVEMMLPYIVERKRMDDFGGSIKDGRFHEQKFRLKQCGLRNVIYLVENYGNEARLGLPINTIHQAAVNTQVVDNFHVKYTNNYHHAMLYLSVLTKQFINIFKDKTLFSCAIKEAPVVNLKDDIASLITFEEFVKTSVKHKVLKVREMFIKHLLQLKGLSVDKALAITNLYSSPRRLISAFKSSTKPELLLANIQCGSLCRNIGPSISKTVYQLYCGDNFS